MGFFVVAVTQYFNSTVPLPKKLRFDTSVSMNKYSLLFPFFCLFFFERSKEVSEEVFHKYWVNVAGSKFASVISYLKKIWRISASNRVIIFSQVWLHFSSPLSTPLHLFLLILQKLTFDPEPHYAGANWHVSTQQRDSMCSCKRVTREGVGGGSGRRQWEEGVRGGSGRREWEEEVGGGGVREV